MADEFFMILFLINSTINFEVFTPVFFLKWKLINVLTVLRFFALFYFTLFYFWGHYSQATKSSFLSSDSSLHTLECCSSGCLHGVEYFLPPINLRHGWRVFLVVCFQLCSTESSKVSFYVSLFEIKCIKFQTIDLVLNLF